jgi:hypothetical protein
MRLSGSNGVRRTVRIAKEGDRLEPVTTIGALPEIRDAAGTVLEPGRRGNRLATLRARISMRQISMGQIVRYGSDHDASPICFIVANSHAEPDGRQEIRAVILDSCSRQICDETNAGHKNILPFWEK